ncbi:hypothetical protein [Myxococcus sp. RHSTA-1-4]|uniref:hypothetical protein n=1 Tax=Myxococcus sp. RHSTA-1-4 TaxID=2874601 RepID=UPI001CBBF5A3|nr:hypothetical protein [Myxococcus sp. RHSTA-1-4]MBZ4422425.1 hypothetical protein [Myxococcus sp. RHSTA-1-4]
MVNQVSRVEGEEGPVEGINPKDPPPEITQGLTLQPYSAKMSVPTSQPAVETSTQQAKDGE